MVHDKNKSEKIANFLRAMNDKKLWKRSNGRFNEVHASYSLRAIETMVLYNGLRLPFLSRDEKDIINWFCAEKSENSFFKGLHQDGKSILI